MGYPIGPPQAQARHQPSPPQEQQWQPPQDVSPQPLAIQPAGFLPPPPSWNGSQSTAPPPPPYQDQRPYAPIIVNQHYYLSNGPFPSTAVTGPYLGGHGSTALSKLGSMVDVASEIVPGSLVHHMLDDGLPRWHCHATQLLNQSAALYDQISSTFNNVMTRIDCGNPVGNEKDLFSYQQVPPSSMVGGPPVSPPSSAPSSPPVDRALPKKRSKKDAPKGQTTAVASSLISGGYFAKVDHYANSRLPMDLPPLRLYIPTYPLLCLAAQYSERVYEKPRGAERNSHVEPDWRTGTKAMYIKSVPMDHMNTIVFAIRGTATFMDWAVNLNTAPTSPSGFLDDTSNLCHAGFLSVARNMVKPVAARLRQLLEEDPGRCEYSLLITGHSAGGAVASLLYSHILSTSRKASSELNLLAGCFKRIHCINFGAPPVSIRPLVKPDRPELRKSLFLSFVNEGDPVARADKAYVKSLLELFATPTPVQLKVKSKESSSARPLTPPPSPGKKPGRGAKSERQREREKRTESTLAAKGSHKSSSDKPSSRTRPKKPVWEVPPSTLSNAGRIVVLRTGNPKAKVKNKKTVEERLNEGVVAQLTSDEQLRGVIWGDPVCHVMRLYAGRIETLAVGAVTAKGF
ncbi:Alpha/Beta hydrolase protein [Xylariales sp. PMI_506]|nr:Alpha/Beta hydrolase protein [Xylariales sp. PMI_506]